MFKTFSLLLGLLFAQQALACEPQDVDCNHSDDLYYQCEAEQPTPVCHLEDYERADAKLNQVYKLLKSQLSPAEFAKVKKSQQQWLKKMTKECACEDCPHQGPVFECKAGRTWKRALYLQSLIPR